MHGYRVPVFDGKKTADIVGLLPFKGSEVQGSIIQRDRVKESVVSLYTGLKKGQSDRKRNLIE